MNELEQIIAEARAQGMSEEDIAAITSEYESNSDEYDNFTVEEPVNEELNSIVEEAKAQGMSEEDIASITEEYNAGFSFPEETQEDIDPSDYDADGEKYVFDNPFLRRLEDTVIGDVFQDMYNEGVGGFKDLEQISATNEVADGSFTQEELQRYINAVNASRNHKTTKEMEEFQKEKDECGGGAWCTLKAIAKNPSVASGIMARSLVSMMSGEGLATAATVGAGAGLASGGALAAPAFFGTLSAYTDGMMSFTDFLTEELDGKEFNEANVAALLQNPEKMSRIRGRAAARGIAIGVIDGLTLGISAGITKGGKTIFKGALGAGSKTSGAKTVVRGVGAKVASRTGSKGLGVAAGAATEAVGGSLGEFAGQVASGQEIDTGEILLEGLAEVGSVTSLKGAVQNSLQIRRDILDGKTGELGRYQVNGQYLTKEEFTDSVTIMSDEELANANLGVTDDVKMTEQVDNLVQQAKIKTELRQQNQNLSEEQINKITPIQQEYNNLEGDSIATTDRKNELRQQIKEILHPELKKEEGDSKTETKPKAESKPAKTPATPEAPKTQEANAVQQVQGETAEGVLRDERVENEVEAEAQKQFSQEEIEVIKGVDETVDPEPLQKVKIEDENFGQKTPGKTQVAFKRASDWLGKQLDKPTWNEENKGHFGMNSIFVAVPETAVRGLMKAVKVAIDNGQPIAVAIDTFVDKFKEFSDIKRSRLISHVENWLNSDEAVLGESPEQEITVQKGKKAKPRNKKAAEEQAAQEAKVRQTVEERFDAVLQEKHDAKIKELQDKIDNPRTAKAAKANAQAELDALIESGAEKVNLEGFTDKQIKQINLLRRAGIDAMPNELADKIELLENPNASQAKVKVLQKDLSNKIYNKDLKRKKAAIASLEKQLARYEKVKNPNLAMIRTIKAQLVEANNLNVEKVDLSDYGPKTLKAIKGYLNTLDLPGAAIVEVAAKRFEIDPEVRKAITKKYVDIMDKYRSSGKKNNGVAKFFQDMDGETMLKSALGGFVSLDRGNQTQGIVGKIAAAIDIDENITDQDLLDYRSEWDVKRDLTAEEMREVVKKQYAAHLVKELHAAGLINAKEITSFDKGKKTPMYNTVISNQADFVAISSEFIGNTKENKSKRPLDRLDVYRLIDGVWKMNGRPAVIGVSNPESKNQSPESMDAIDAAQDQELRIADNGWLNFYRDFVFPRIEQSHVEEVEKLENDIANAKDEKTKKQKQKELDELITQQTADIQKLERQYNSAEGMLGKVFFLQKARGKNGRFYTLSDDVTFQADKGALTFIDVPKVPVTPEIMEQILEHIAVTSGIKIPEHGALLNYAYQNINEWLSWIQNPTPENMAKMERMKEPELFMRGLYEYNNILNGGQSTTGILLEIDDRASGIQMYTGAIGLESEMRIANLSDPDTIYDPYEEIANFGINNRQGGIEVEEISTEEALEFVQQAPEGYESINDMIAQKVEEANNREELAGGEEALKRYREIERNTRKNPPQEPGLRLRTEEEQLFYDEVRAKAWKHADFFKDWKKANRAQVSQVIKLLFSDPDVSSFTRDTFKKAISTIPYGASVGTNSVDILQAWKKYGDKVKSLKGIGAEGSQMRTLISLTQNEAFSAILGSNIADAFKKKLPVSFELMGALKEAVVEAYEEGRVLKYELPDGFLFVNESRRPKTKRIDVGEGKNRLSITMAIGDGGLSLANMRKQIAPNFAHMLDAQLASYIYRKSIEDGVTVAINHDGFMTTPDNLEWLKNTLLEAKEKLFEKDIVSEFFHANFPQERAEYYINKVKSAAPGGTFVRKKMQASEAINSTGTGAGTTASPVMSEFKKAYKENQKALDKQREEHEQEVAQKLQCK